MATIHDRGTTITVTVLGGELVVGVDAGPLEPPAPGFLLWYRDKCRAFKLSYSQGREDLKVAGRLLEQHGRKELEELATEFLRRHAEPLFDGTYNRPMILLAAKIPEIREELRRKL